MKTRTHRPASIERAAVVSTNRIDEELQRYDAYFRLTAREIGFFTASQFCRRRRLALRISWSQLFLWMTSQYQLRVKHRLGRQ